VRGNASATVSWVAPASNGGSAITGYTVTSSPGGFAASTTGALSFSVTGLTNGSSYTFSVVAANGVGVGPASAPSNAVTPSTVPSAPNILSATRGNAQVSVIWTLPASNGGAPIAGYTVTSSPGSFTSTTSATSAVVPGLTNGTSYTFTVVATNVAGSSLPSAASAPVVPATTPGPPTSVVGTRGASGQVIVSWNSPASNGGLAITNYTVTATPGGMTASSGGALNLSMAGLTNGTPYTFSVVAINAIGPGLASVSSAPVIPATFPSPPGKPTATAGSGQAAVSWTAPASNGGLPLTSYIVTSSPGALTAMALWPSLSANVAGLINGTQYTFTVRAISMFGSSPPSLPSDPVTPGVNLSAIWVNTSSSAWAVGNQGSITRWSGGSWNPQSSSTTADLRAIWADTTNSVWAVGTGGTIVRWNGGNWNQDSSGTTSDLNAVWGNSSNFVWAVGKGGTIVRFNGGNWNPESSGTTAELVAIWGNSTNQVWAVGKGGVIVRWNGGNWNLESSGTSNDLLAIFGTGSNSVWAVGKGGTIVRFNGGSWNPESSGTTNDLVALTGEQSSYVWAVGRSGTIVRWNGGSWNLDSSGTTSDLNAIWSSTTTTVWAVGRGGTIIRWNGGSWNQESSGTTSDLNAIAADASNSTWVVGNTATITWWTGGGWNPQPSGL